MCIRVRSFLARAQLAVDVASGNGTSGLCVVTVHGGHHQVSMQQGLCPLTPTQGIRSISWAVSDGAVEDTGDHQPSKSCIASVLGEHCRWAD